MPVPIPVPAVSDLRKEVEEESAASTSAPIVAPKDDPRDQEEYDFSFTYKTARGEPFTGDFTNKILSIGQRRLASNLRARLQGGQPIVAFDPLQVELNRLIAHLEFSLTRKPDWAKDLEKLNDAGLIMALGKEVGQHEATFHRLEETEG